MIRRLNRRKAVIRLSLTCLFASTALIVVTIAKRPPAAILPDHGAVPSAQAARRYQDLLRSREQAQRAVPEKIGSEVFYSPKVKRNVLTFRYIVSGKGEILVTAADEAAFLKPYQDTLDAREKAVADFQSGQGNSHYSKE